MVEFLEGIFNRLKELFDPKTLGKMFADSLSDVIVGLVVFLAFYFAWLVLRRIIRPTLERSHLDETMISFVETVTKFGLLIIGIVAALDSAGVNTSAMLASLGIVGLTIGFAARDALSNLISGILIFIDRPFVVGDLVELQDEYGMVDRITLRSTRIITSDGKMLAVPNTEVINQIVASYTNFPHLRLDIPVTVGVNEDLERARQIMLRLVQDNPEYMKEPSPRVVITQLNDYNVEMELQAWLKDERTHVEKRSELREGVFNALNGAGVMMPYETIKLTPLDVRVHQGS
jgi:small conductance mechanosensitive channel